MKNAISRLTKRLGLATGAVCLLGSAALAQTGREVVVATTGGVFDQALKEIWFEPFARATGTKVTTVIATDAEQRAKAQAMSQSGNVSWDIIINVDIHAAAPQNRAITEDLTEFCKLFSNRPDLSENACNPTGVRISYNGTLLAYNSNKFPNRKPQNWADFWNVKDFPGPRALPNFGDPWRVFAAALLADGVPADKLFPLDIDRALKKLDEIRPQVQLWWKTGDQSQQGFRNGEYVTAMIWGTRANALRAEKQPLEMSFDQAFLLADTMQVLKKSPNRDGALALMKFYLDNPDVQAKFAERFGVAPVSTKAIEMMSEEGRSKIPNSPEAFRKVIKHDAAWITANQAAMLERWNTWIQK